MTERTLFRRLMKRLGIAVLLYILLTAGILLLGPKNLVETFDGMVYTGESDKIYDAERMTASCETPGIVEITLYDKGLYVYADVKGLQKGETWVTYATKDTGEIIGITKFRVYSNHTVLDVEDGNYSNWELQRLLVLVLMLAVTIILWESFYTAQKKTGYSYHAIFCSGFGIWLLAADAMILNFLRHRMSMRSLYAKLQLAAGNFLFYSIPFLLIFAIVLSISNLSLIRREGFRVRNALGIGISGVMILGAVIYVLIYFKDFSGSEFSMHVSEAFCGAYAAVYCLLECFLLGSVICGSLAAGHEPKYDKDYIVILGCRVAKDGTLYPLIRGRVDRAIEFYKAQLEKTGKKAIFVPSGGKGGDEPVSEAAAMKRYLLEQGFSEADILVEDQSKNTMQNMKFSKKLIEERTPGAKAAFSTTNYHVFRSGIISRQQEFPAEGMGGKTKWYFWPNAYIRETIGMITYCWKSLVVLMVILVAFFSFLAFQ